MGLDQNEKWAIELHFVTVKSENMEHLGWQKPSSSRTSINSQVENDCQTPSYQHPNCKSVVSSEIKFHLDGRILELR